MKNHITFITLIKNKDPEATLYLLGILVGFIGLGIYGLTDLVDQLTGIPLFDGCIFRRITGIYCPGCGGTRAAVCMIHGQVIHSIYYNPAVPYLIVVIGVFYISQTLRYLTHGRISGMKFHMFYVIIFVGLMILNFIIKNYFLFVHHIYIIS